MCMYCTVHECTPWYYIIIIIIIRMILRRGYLEYCSQSIDQSALLGIRFVSRRPDQARPGHAFFLLFFFFSFWEINACRYVLVLQKESDNRSSRISESPRRQVDTLISMPTHHGIYDILPTPWWISISTPLLIIILFRPDWTEQNRTAFE